MVSLPLAMLPHCLTLTSSISYIFEALAGFPYSQNAFRFRHVPIEVRKSYSGTASSTATAVLFSPLTAGISLVGLGLSAPRIHNARKKRAIIEAKLQAHGQTHNTRKRDVIAPMAISGTIGGLTLGLAGPGADLIAGEAVGKGAEYAAAQ